MLKNRKNKKGFMLIELMAVIAIIAILVSIAVPIVQKENVKAAAAANAANLRSVVGKLAAMKASNEDDFAESYGANAKEAGTIIKDGASPLLGWLGWDNFANWADNLLYENTADDAGNLYWRDSNTLIIGGVPGAQAMKVKDSNGNLLTIAEGTPMTVYITDTAIAASYYTVTGDKLGISDFADIAEDGVYDGGVTNSAEEDKNFWEGMESMAAIEYCKYVLKKHNPDPNKGCYCSNCHQVDHLGKAEGTKHNCQCGKPLETCDDVNSYEYVDANNHKCKVCGQPDPDGHTWDNNKCNLCKGTRKICEFKSVLSSCKNPVQDGTNYCANHQYTKCTQLLDSGEECGNEYPTGGRCNKEHALISSCRVTDAAGNVCGDTAYSVYNGNCRTHRNYKKCTLATCGAWYSGASCTNTAAHGHTCSFTNHQCTYAGGCDKTTSCHHNVLGYCTGNEGDCGAHKDNCVKCGSDHTCSHSWKNVYICPECKNSIVGCPAC